jgi:hypothetical protein
MDLTVLRETEEHIDYSFFLNDSYIHTYIHTYILQQNDKHLHSDVHSEIYQRVVNTSKINK